MNNSINLLDYKDRVERKKESRNTKILRFTAISLLFLVSAFSITFFILIALSPLPDLERQQNAASLTLSQSINDIIKLKLVKERASGVAEILENRKSYNLFIDYLRENIPEGVVLKSLVVSESGIEFALESASLSQIDSFFRQLSSNENNEVFFSEVNVPKISADSGTGLFIAQLNISL